MTDASVDKVSECGPDISSPCQSSPHPHSPLPTPMGLIMERNKVMEGVTVSLGAALLPAICLSLRLRMGQGKEGLGPACLGEPLILKWMEKPVLGLSSSLACLLFFRSTGRQWSWQLPTGQEPWSWRLFPHTEAWVCPSWTEN